MNTAMLLNHENIICPLTGVSDGASLEHRNPEDASVFDIGEIMEKPTTEYLLNLPVKIYKGGKNSIRRFNAVQHKDTTYILSHLIWNYYNPDDLVKSGEVVHHIDGNTINDSPDNLTKMTNGDHTKLHRRNVSSFRASDAIKLKRLGLTWGGVAKSLNVHKKVPQSYFRRRWCCLPEDIQKTIKQPQHMRDACPECGGLIKEAKP